MNYSKLLLVSGQLLLVSFLNAQIIIESKQTVEFYVRNVLMGPGVEVRNIQYTGMTGGMGQFDANKRIIGVKSGIVLSTGLVDSVIGPNNSSSQTTTGKFPLAKKEKRKVYKGDADLNKLCRRKTFDIAVIEFDFIPVNNKLHFNYVFASEEYTEYVNSKYNDVFGFFLSGKELKKKVNLAHLPNRRKTPVTINNINHLKHRRYFRRNNGFVRRAFVYSPGKDSLWNAKKSGKLINQLEYDGMTTVLQVNFDVVPYKVYHIKIAIGDVSDRNYDSGVFIEAGSFVSIEDSTGTYYSVVKEIKKNNKPLNIDSIFHGKKIVKTIPAPVTQTESDKDTILAEKVIYFPVASDIPDSASRINLEEILAFLQTNPSSKIELYGYTDHTGNYAFNQKLAEKRTAFIIKHLAAAGISEKRIIHFAEDFLKPRSDGTTEKGRAENRRVEVFIIREL